MAGSYIDQQWPIDGGTIRLIVESEKPIAPWYWAEIGSLVEQIEVAQAALPSVPERGSASNE